MSLIDWKIEDEMPIKYLAPARAAPPPIPASANNQTSRLKKQFPGSKEE